jgi:uncharacterized protein YlzI (FlbEa/FlbD family)
MENLVEEEEVKYKALEKIYEGDKKSWIAPNESAFDGLNITDPKYTASTYGELTPKGASQIVRKFRKHFMDPEAVFYDLGCGIGRFISHVSVLTNVKKSCGVELCNKRCNKALSLIESVETFPASTPTLINGNFLEQDYSDATIVYIDNTMYNVGILETVTKMVPPECIVVYQRGWLQRGDPFFYVETTYNNNLKDQEHSLVSQLTSKTCGWTYGAGHEF